MRLIKSIIQEKKKKKKKKMSSEENPCWKGYKMIGTKMKDGKEVPNCVPISKESVKTYLSKDLLDSGVNISKKENFTNYLSKRLGISLNEALILKKEIKNYYKNLKEVDLKKPLIAGTMALTSMLPSKLNATNDYFRSASYLLEPSRFEKLSPKEKLDVVKNLQNQRHSKDDEWHRYQRIIDQLENKLKQNYVNYYKRKKQLDEMSWEEVKNFGKKAIASTLLISSSFMPIAQSLYGNDSCKIDSSGQVVSCDANKLRASKPVKILLGNIQAGIEQTKSNMDDPEFKKFVPGELNFIIQSLTDLSQRKDATPEEKKDIENELNNVINLKKSIENELKKIKKLRKNFK